MKKAPFPHSLQLVFTKAVDWRGGVEREFLSCIIFPIFKIELAFRNTCIKKFDLMHPASSIKFVGAPATRINMLVRKSGPVH